MRMSAKTHRPRVFLKRLETHADLDAAVKYAAEHASEIQGAVPCEKCGAAVGEPCSISPTVHLGRAINWAGRHPQI